MTIFNNAIVRTPSASLIHGITSSKNLGAPNYEKALQQHETYIHALNSCGVSVTILPESEKFPDSCFVEDVALLTEKVAILTRPGAQTRQGEVELIKSTVSSFYTKENIRKIYAPGTLEAGDVLNVKNHFYIGISARTNNEGAKQLIDILNEYEYTASTIPLKTMLHLKTGISFIGKNSFLLADECIEYADFCKVNRIIVAPDESYAANCIMINGTVLMPLGFPKTEAQMRELKFDVKTIDVSEFRKLDGGLSCLSLRF